MAHSTELVPTENTWDSEIDYDRYGFEVLGLKLDGRMTDFKVIYRKETGRIVAIPRQNYKLLPNEVVLGVANSVAKKANLKPFKMISESIDDWRTFTPKSKYRKSAKQGFTMVQEVVGDKHALMDAEATRMYAFFTLPEKMMDGAKEVLNFGICVANSVDTTQGLSVMGFTYRHLCQNASLMTLKQVMAQNKVLGMYSKHTKHMKVNAANLEKWMLEAAGKMGNIQTTYATWMVEDIPKETVNRIGRWIPQKYFPEYIKKDGKKTLMTRDPTPTTWKVYNDLTQQIWHEPVELKTKQVLFESLHYSFGM